MNAFIRRLFARLLYEGVFAASDHGANAKGPGRPIEAMVSFFQSLVDMTDERADDEEPATPAENIEALISAGAEEGQGVMFVVGTGPAGVDFALFVAHPVGNGKAEFAGVEGLEGLGVAGRQGQMLERRVKARRGLGFLGRLRCQAKHDGVAVRVAHGEGALVK